MGVVVPEKGKLAERCGTETREARFLTGCAMLIKREVFETVGLFDEDFFLYEEDLDFCLRAARAEYRLVYEPAALVWHKISPVGGDRTSPTVMYHRARSRILMLRKDFPRIRCMYGFLLHVLVYTPVRFLQISRGTRTLDSARAWLGGTWAGIRFPISSSGGAHEAIK
jgi:GT2 family glycosyltransferase